METQNEQRSWKIVPVDFIDAGSHKPSVGKKHSICEVQLCEVRGKELCLCVFSDLSKFADLMPF